MNSLDPHPHSVMKNSIHSVCDLSKKWMKSLCSSILCLVKSQLRMSTITTIIIVFLLYRIWKAKGANISSSTMFPDWMDIIIINNTGTILFILWNAKDQLQKEIEEAKALEAGASISSSIILHHWMDKIMIINSGTILFILWNAKGASISSSTMFHHWMDIIIINNTGTTLFILWNAKEQLEKAIEKAKPSEAEQLQKEIEKAKPSEAEHGELRTQIETLQGKDYQLQTELHQLQTKLHQLQNELEWRKARNETDDITLDAGTAHPNLSIAGDKKSLKHEAQPQKVPASPERFDSTVCVLGFEGFSSGKHYWEVDVKKISDWDLGVAKESIQRKGKLSLSPKEGFWALGLSGRDYWAKTDPWTQVMVQKKPQKIGVYLNYQDGRVTFFNVTDMSVLFTFNDCSFSGELYPFFKNSHKETTMRVCSIKEE
ncbi:butyrophilin subfamily 3 member A1-like isoform X3 [Malaclemys terrapin pileata]|uniref:butyrophilin subfamily 3 member A1-like isoform X3 n=1 Tax=Malaclemys terrapin pileata TaxID=2991368 RepID=UPI0023A8DF18|nr:butyrophilin subfamily 3 member A1-like isoform X3 [Malaclemys terrapin pileata]